MTSINLRHKTKYSYLSAFTSLLHFKLIVIISSPSSRFLNLVSCLKFQSPGSIALLHRVPYTTSSNNSGELKMKSKSYLKSSLSFQEDIRNDYPMLFEWITHNSSSYHNFSNEEAAAIRSALLGWYRLNRRILPWRGDEPPFDGSTAGINDTSKRKNEKKRVMNKNGTLKGQKQIESFFVKKNDSSTSSPPSNETIPDVVTSLEYDKEMKSAESKKALPVTGYGVWVSEIMLQQTRVEAVIPYYIKWMKSFPTVHALSEASEEDINSHWAGLGFYRRARLLHKGAKYVVNELGGIVPETVDELMRIDGIGRYTASAISSIAFDRCEPVVDGNVCRVLSRLRGIANNIKSPILKDKYCWDLAKQIVTAGDGKHAGEVNQALMELGATYCAPSGTGIDERDPLRDFYVSTKLGREMGLLMQTNSLTSNEFISKLNAHKCSCDVCEADGIVSVFSRMSEDIVNNKRNDVDFLDMAAAVGHGNFPTPPAIKEKRVEILAVIVLSHECNNQRESKWLMVKRPEKGLLAGQWEFPSSCTWSQMESKDIDIPQLPMHDLRSNIDEILENVLHTEDAKLKSILNTLKESGDDRETLPAPIEHIFSHVKHIMWINYGSIRVHDSMNIQKLQSSNDREYRWMSESEMQTVGITSGVKKVLESVKKSQDKSRPPSKKQKKNK